MTVRKNKVIDLFAGVGGLSLGAARAGFEVAAAVELDQIAIAQHALNFPNSKHLMEDVAALSGDRLAKLSDVRPGELCGLIGGPPCQGFSEIGLKGNDDPRNQLLGHFFRLVAEMRPAFFLAENVPGVTHSRNKTIVEEALSRVPDSYIMLPPMTVKANDYGAPTTRTRVFFFGFDPNRVAPLQAESFLPPVRHDVRVSRALSGLPVVRSDWQSEVQSWRAVNPLPEGFYEDRIAGHIPAGVGNKEAIAVYAAEYRVSGCLGTLHTAETKRRFRSLLPGTTDPISRSVRLRMDGYCPTLRAGTGPERGSYQAIRPIHPSSPRVISPREGARLQGFPDWFQFHPTKWHAFRQIGNSVSPIVSEALLSSIFRAVS
ncbi:Modification methylase HaeIII [Achromobacter pulmonis]|uniref:DNA (cytosine-5-)-methyltransferase n=1 Tax=Achromobacter pulmonis TaxID=1389932 RepID=A0A6S7D3N5_9BURK|nr:DNA cytosine methyltransferase [Achromobacter pulmonis]CAB3858860.1 Modification methylase HaeIII [Achromobacter pulmonis]